MSQEALLERKPEKPPLTPVERKWDGLLFGVKRSVRYHTRRRCFFERAACLTNFLTVFTGGGTGISAIVGADSWITATLGFITAGLASADLIIGYSTKAREYHDLARDFIALEREMVSLPAPPSEQDLSRIVNKRLELEADEPPKLCLLDLICHNEVTRALGRKDDYLYNLPRWRRLLCHFHDFDTSSLRTFGQIRADSMPKPAAG